MRISFRKVLRFLSPLVLGAIIGAAALAAYLAPELDRDYLERQTLKLEILDLKDRLAKLEQEKTTVWQRVRIRDVAIELEYEGDPFAEVEIRKLVRELVKDIIGRTTAEVDFLLLFKLLDGRIAAVEDNHFRLEALGIVVDRRTTFYLRVHRISDQEELP